MPSVTIEDNAIRMESAIALMASMEHYVNVPHQTPLALIRIKRYYFLFELMIDSFTSGVLRSWLL